MDFFVIYLIGCLLSMGICYTLTEEIPDTPDNPRPNNITMFIGNLFLILLSWGHVLWFLYEVIKTDEENDVND